MPPNPPYLLFGFDVDPSDPSAADIIRDVEHDFPLTAGIVSLGVEHLFLVEVQPSQMTAKLRQVNSYLVQKDEAHAGVLRWMVQLCRSSEIGSG
jgi:hypothetical protein